jgi:ParB-like chromosome segregation protein Spo0J
MPRTNVLGTTAPPGSGAQRCAQAGEREHGIESTAGTAAPAARSSPFHPLADRFPLIEGVEFDELVADIKANGLIEPIVMLDGMILDGRNRYRACVAADVEPTFRPFTGDDPAAYVISANIHRRHLTAEQKRDLIAERIKATPEKSDRAIADMLKVSPTTVGKVRRATIHRGQLPEKRIGKDGKARKPPAKKVKPVPPPDAPQKMAAVTDAVGSDGSATKAAVFAPQQGKDLAEQLRLAEIKIAGLESENQELKAERDRLHQSLAEAHAANLALIEQLMVHVPAEPPVTFGDPGPIPELLRRDRVSS